MSEKKKILVVGGGPGGYVAAIRAAQLGGEVTLVEKEHLGGTCLNVGCIPTKAMLHASEFVKGVAEAEGCGVDLTLKEIDWDRVIGRKNEVIKTLVGGVSGLLARSKVRVVEGRAKFIGIGRVCITTEAGEEIVEPDRIILATGSRPSCPPIEGLRESAYAIDSTGALSLKECPEEIVILGGGVIGVEFACAFNAFGSKVTIIEALPRLIPTLDGGISDQLARLLEEQGIELHLNTRVTGVTDSADAATVCTKASDGTEQQFTTRKLLVALGRKPYVEDLGLDEAGIKTENGHIVVNKRLQTSAPGVYAIGDCVGQIMLAHTASAQGECAAENALGEPRDYAATAIPSCIYAFPEVASVGLTEEQAKEQGLAYHVGVFPLSANGRSLILNGGKGTVKVLVGDELGEVLGVHVLGPNATEIIGEAAVAMEMEATAEEIINTVHAHPSVSEALREAFLASEGRAIHIPNKKR